MVDSPVAPGPTAPSAESVRAWSGRLRAAVPRPWRSPRRAAIDAVLADPSLRAGLFRFVDVLPACTDDADVVAHLRELIGADGPWWFRAGVTASGLPGGERAVARAARSQVRAVAKRFVLAEDAASAAPAVASLWRDGVAATVDLLGERTLSDAEADRYAARVTDMLERLASAAVSWPERTALKRDRHGPLGRVHLSVKPTALSPHLTARSAERGIDDVLGRLCPIVARAGELGAMLTLDMEQFDVKDATVELVHRVWSASPGVRLGAVVQAYTTSGRGDIARHAALGRRLRTEHGDRFEPLQVRLVKGAYWDAEQAQAEAEGWSSPVWAAKGETDESFARCAEDLVAAADVLRPAFAGHNLDSLAHALAAVEAADLSPTAVEVQVLRGMGENVAAAVRSTGVRTRIYCPVGALVPGMGYLVRRLLENTSNESFLGLDPRGQVGTRARPVAAAPASFVNEATAELRTADVREQLRVAVLAAQAAPTREVPAIVAGEPRDGVGTFSSDDPARVDHVVAVAAESGAQLAREAVEVAARAQRGWAAAGWHARADVLDRWADALAAQRIELCGLIAVEVGKPVHEADVEVCEAIDFCRYYAAGARVLADGGHVLSVAGERNAYSYRPRGVVAVVAPWNFPLSIPCGMTAAALVCGNAVVLKPAEQSPAVAAELVRLAHEAGVDPAVLALLPGDGPTTGAALVDQPDVSLIAFTGSRAVGLALRRAAAQDVPGRRDLTRVVAELGGKNPLIVDSDADLDVAVPAIVSSAFGFAGQKCSAVSRAVVVGDAGPVVERLAGAVEAVAVGTPADLATTCGPVIDDDAVLRWSRVMAEVRGSGTVHALGSAGPSGGRYVAPAVVEVDPESWVWRDELFLPVVALARARNLDAAMALANDTPYGLTAGYVGRLPSSLARAAHELRAGNVYLNRSTTGAVVGRQPFGGIGASGVGSKAGGPDYLREFCDLRVVSENTMRHGFAPELLDPGALGGEEGDPR